MPQNSLISGEAYWHGVQLDEVAVPVLLAWRLHRANLLRDFDPWTLIGPRGGYLVRNGPVTAKERWEENSGYSPSTLAAIIASLVAAAEFRAERRGPPHPRLPARLCRLALRATSKPGRCRPGRIG